MAVYMQGSRRRWVIVAVAVVALLIGIGIGYVIGNNTATTSADVLAESRSKGEDAATALQRLPIEYEQAVSASGESSATITGAIDEATGGVTSTLTIDEAVQALPGIEEQNSTFTAIIYVTLFVAGLVMALFFALLTLERIGLYGMLKAIGGSTGQIFAGVVAQAVLVSLVSFSLGAALTLLLSRLLPAQIPLALVPSRAVQIVISLVVMSVLGAAVSLRRVIRVEPASSIG